MIKVELKVIDPTGLHARPASILSSAAGKYSSKIEIERGEKRANLKSIMGILALGIGVDTEIAICAEGEDEELAVANLVELMKTNKFAE
ncbi:MAG: HPr family phosphocarrier protein [Bacillota bacterium]